MEKITFSFVHFIARAKFVLSLEIVNKQTNCVKNDFLDKIDIELFAKRHVEKYVSSSNSTAIAED